MDIHWNSACPNDFVDANKNFFAGPNIEAAKKFTLTQRFKNWFRNSRVVDHNNDPLVVYHGTTRDWDTFDPKKAIQSGSLGFHAGSVSQARDFVREKLSSNPDQPRSGGKIMPVFLSIQNPLRTEDLGTWRPERVAAYLTSKGIEDTETRINPEDKPRNISMMDWGNFTDAQRKMYASSERQVKQELAEGKLVDYTSLPVSQTIAEKDYEFSAIQKVRERRDELNNQYVIDLLKSHGYDGVVYKNIAEGKLSSGGIGGTHSSGDSYIAFDPTQIKSATGNSGEFSKEKGNILEHKIYDSAPKDYKKQVEDFEDKIARQKVKMSDIVDRIKSNPDVTHVDIASDPEWMQANRNYAKMLSHLKQLQGFDLGEVHQLANGDKVTYLSDAGFQRFENLLGRKKVPAGTVFSGSDLSNMLNKVRNAKTMPDWEKEQVRQLIYNGQGKNGEMVIVSATGGGYKKLSSRLWTLREELLHGWQYSLGKAWGNHLSKDDSQALKASMPKEILTHLNTVGYKDFPSHMKVIEAAAKFMATTPEDTMMPRGEQVLYNRLLKAEKDGTINPDEAQSLDVLKKQVEEYRAKAKKWMNQYFQAIKDKHGDTAFDELTHTTKLARDWNREFTNAEIRGTGTGPNEEALGSVGAGGGAGAGGGSGRGVGEGPPEPGPRPEPEPEWDGDWRKLFPPSTSDGVPQFEIPAIESWQDGAQHPALPSNLVERVNKAKARNYTPEQTQYIQSMLRAYAHVAQGLTPKELELYKNLRKADDDNWATGYNHGIIKSIVDNHIQHMWGNDPKKGYPAATEAASGAFAINATQARHRSWATAFEGILDGRQLKVHDPSAIIANGADQIAQASAHRRALELLAKGRQQPDGSYITLKDPGGRLILTFTGMGRNVPGEDGSSSSILVNPNIVKNILMQPADIKRLTDSGLLDTYLRDGRVVDRTPQVGQGNVKEWIGSTQKKLDKLREKKPSTWAPVEERKTHEAGWGQLHLFAKEQAQKISEYMEEALQKLRDEGPKDQKGNYAPLPIEDKPTDFTMVKTLGDVLHGKNNRITPSDLVRLEEYAERQRNHANGLSGNGTTDIRPFEVARLLGQEKDHLDKELTEYLDQTHDKVFGPRQEDGGWTDKGLNRSVLHIAHAAENTEFPQLTKDLLDLKHVDNVYTGNLTLAARIAMEEELAKNNLNLKTASSEQYGEALKAVKGKFRSLQLDQTPDVTARNKEEALGLLKEINERQPKKYLWAPKSHIAIDHPAFKGWKWMASAADGTPTLAESDMARL